MLRRPRHPKHCLGRTCLAEFGRAPLNRAVPASASQSGTSPDWPNIDDTGHSLPRLPYASEQFPDTQNHKATNRDSLNALRLAFLGQAFLGPTCLKHALPILHQQDKPSKPLYDTLSQNIPFPRRNQAALRRSSFVLSRNLRVVSIAGSRDANNSLKRRYRCWNARSSRSAASRIVLRNWSLSMTSV